ncbi:MAG: FxsA family protein [Gammaproteobacteria bacterium]|nr:FxsA family protein [Gammaproteobacteria bacterium]
MRVLFLFLIIVPMIELYVLIQVGEEIGALPTVLLTIFTAVGGLALMRAQGLAVMQQAQAAMAAGQPPQQQVMEGVFIFLGGIFLFLPGLISDTLGFLFLLPFVRHFFIQQSVQGMASKGKFGQGSQSGHYYEGEWEEVNPQRSAARRVKSIHIEGEIIQTPETHSDKRSDK